MLLSWPTGEEYTESVRWASGIYVAGFVRSPWCGRRDRTGSARVARRWLEAQGVVRRDGVVGLSPTV